MREVLLRLLPIKSVQFRVSLFFFTLSVFVISVSCFHQAGFYCGYSTIAPSPCPPGTFNANLGSVNVSSCQTCTPGYYCDLQVSESSLSQGESVTNTNASFFTGTVSSVGSMRGWILLHGWRRDCHSVCVSQRLLLPHEVSNLLNTYLCFYVLSQFCIATRMPARHVSARAGSKQLH